VLRRARWDPEAVRDERRRDLREHLGEAHAVEVIEATGCLKQGQHSAGVARQYSGTAGRIDHGQMGVLLADARRHGRARLERARSLPTDWPDDPGRCRQAGIPEARHFATTPPLAQAMRQRTLAGGLPARWVAGDSVYGDDRRLRRWWEAHPHA
jgi:SRSO17 transposase